MEAWRASVSARLTSKERPINMARLMHELNRTLPAEGVLVADGGFAAHWGGLLFDTKRAGRDFLPDRGFALHRLWPAGRDGRRAGPQRECPVVALTGDGGFNMVLGELETAIRMDLDLTVIVVNNAASGYVKALQHLVYGEGAYQASDLKEMDYARVAEAMGAWGRRVEDPDALSETLAAALRHKGPCVLDVVVTRDPAQMLPGVDSRAVTVEKGDRVA